MKPDTATMAPADGIRDFLAQQGLSQSRFAAEHGIDRSHFCNLLNGHARPSLRLASLLERATGVPAGSWYAEQDDARRSA